MLEQKRPLQGADIGVMIIGYERTDGCATARHIRLRALASVNAHAYLLLPPLYGERGAVEAPLNPCLALLRRASPCQAAPRRAAPCLAMPILAEPSPALPCKMQLRSPQLAFFFYLPGIHNKFAERAFAVRPEITQADLAPGIIHDLAHELGREHCFIHFQDKA